MDGTGRQGRRVDHAIDFACRVAARGFTEAEWTAQFGSRPYQETRPGA